MPPSLIPCATGEDTEAQKWSGLPKVTQLSVAEFLVPSLAFLASLQAPPWPRSPPHTLD